MLYALLLPVRNLFKPKSVFIDSKVFQLHSSVTSALFLLLTILYCLKEYVGDPISCLGPKGSSIPLDVITSYCWISSTYSVLRYFDAGSWEKGIYPGVGTLQSWDKTVYHHYYIWIPFYFLFLSIFFYTPRFIWKNVEGGLMKMLKNRLDNPVELDDVKTTQLKILSNYLLESWGFNASYACWFFACEVLNFMFVCFGWVFTDLLLGYKFSNYGPEVMSHWRNGGNDHGGNPVPSPMVIIFPRVTKCEFPYYGPGGNTQRMDYICVLSVNNCNDKVFLFLWFYFVILAAIGGINILYRICVFLFRRMRIIILRWKIQRCSIQLSEYTLLKLTQNFGDWVILDQLSKNIDAIAFADLMTLLANAWDPDKTA